MPTYQSSDNFCIVLNKCFNKNKCFNNFNPNATVISGIICSCFAVIHFFNLPNACTIAIFLLFLIILKILFLFVLELFKPE